MALAGAAAGLPAGLEISGRVDRLVVTPDRVLVVDFKTNRPSPDRIEDADPAYMLQMAPSMPPCWRGSSPAAGSRRPGLDRRAEADAGSRRRDGRALARLR